MRMILTMVAAFAAMTASAQFGSSNKKSLKIALETFVGHLGLEPRTSRL